MVGVEASRFVVRHAAVVGSTGSGKTSAVASLLQGFVKGGWRAANIVVIDPHGEYASAVGEYGRVFKLKPDSTKGEYPLYVPYWALPFEELQMITLGPMQPAAEQAVRDEVTSRRKLAVPQLENGPPATAVTADSPIPFNLRRLWFDLDDYERQTFNDNARTQPSAKASDQN